MLWLFSPWTWATKPTPQASCSAPAYRPCSCKWALSAAVVLAAVLWASGSFAANRVEHSFSPEEISLLSAFADHAAVVLQTARLLATAINGVGGNHEAVLTDGLARATMDAAAMLSERESP